MKPTSSRATVRSWPGCVFVLVATAFSITGCPNGVIDPPSDMLTDPQAVLDLADKRLAGINSLSIAARVSFYSVDGRRSGSATIAVAKPASLHFSALAPGDHLAAFVASDGKRFTSWERGKKICYTGRSCPENVARFFPVLMDGADVVRILSGGAPLMQHHRKELRWDPKEGAYRVTLFGAGTDAQHIWITHRTGLVRRVELYRKKSRVYRLVFEDVDKVGSMLMPRKIKLDMKRKSIDLSVRYREIDINPELDSSPFQIPCPDGTQARELLCSPIP